MLERRFALDHGGRNARTTGAVGGVYAVPVAKGWQLDASLTLGGGVWGAAQLGAARLDVGPSAVLRLPVARRAVALALDWRQRVAGGPAPGSGIAFTLASDF